MSTYTPFTTVDKFSNRIVRVPGLNPGTMTLNGTNTYIIGSGKRRILIDAGAEKTSKEYCELLKSALEQYNCEIGHILVTHGHEDHFGGVPAVLELSRTLGHGTPTIHRLMKPKMIVPDPPGSVKYQNLKDGELNKVEGATIRAVYTPGHCEDHVTFFFVEERVMFSGDCILGDTDTTVADLFDYVKSVEKMAQLNPMTIYPGHGNVVNRAQTKLDGTLRVKKKESEGILQLLEDIHPRALTVDEIAKKNYNPRTKEDMEKTCKYVNQHLSRLCKLMRITTKKEKDVEHYMYMFGI